MLYINTNKWGIKNSFKYFFEGWISSVSSVAGCISSDGLCFNSVAGESSDGLCFNSVAG